MDNSDILDDREKRIKKTLDFIEELKERKRNSVNEVCISTTPMDTQEWSEKELKLSRLILDNVYIFQPYDQDLYGIKEQKKRMIKDILNSKEMYDIMEKLIQFEEGESELDKYTNLKMKKLTATLKLYLK